MVLEEAESKKKIYCKWCRKEVKQKDNPWTMNYHNICSKRKWSFNNKDKTREYYYRNWENINKGNKKWADEHPKRIREIKRKWDIKNNPRKGYNSGWFRKGHPVSEKTREAVRKSRAKQIFPKRDSKIELKIQTLLTKLHIEFYTHKYISEITHAYQCDVLIPKQNGIGKKTIIECDGCFFHACPTCKIKEYPWTLKRKDLDKIRTRELKENGFRIIRLWEHEIKSMNIEELGGILNVR